jgi:hypothetical protein
LPLPFLSALFFSPAAFLGMTVAPESRSRRSDLPVDVRSHPLPCQKRTQLLRNFMGKLVLTLTTFNCLAQCYDWLRRAQANTWSTCSSSPILKLACSRSDLEAILADKARSDSMPYIARCRPCRPYIAVAFHSPSFAVRLSPPVCRRPRLGRRSHCLAKSSGKECIPEPHPT